MDIRAIMTVSKMKSEEETRIAQILLIIIVISLILTITYLLIAMFESPFQLPRFLMSLTMLLMIFASYALLRMQNVFATSIVVSTSGLIFTTVTVLLTGGIQAPMVGGYFIIFLVAGILLGKRGGLIFTVLSLISWTGIFVVEYSGNLPESLVRHDIIRIWILNSMLFVIAATVIYLATKYLSEALVLVKGQRDNLEEMVSIRTRELEDANKDLKNQQEDLIHAEQQRVMMESVGAALHHFSQPLTAMEMAIDTIMTDERSDEIQKEKLYDLYKKSKKDLDDIIKKFQQVRKYRTKPYAVGTKILDIDSDPDEN